jgi:hypothetical protein
VRPVRPRVWQPVGVTGSPYARARHAVVAVASVGLLGGLLVACSAERSEAPVESPALRVAVGPEGESQLLARTIIVLLEDAGISAETVVLADGRSVRQAIELGDVDLVVAYSGEEWLTRLGRADPPGDPAAGFEVLAGADRERGLTWLVPTFGSGVEEPPANATFAFFVAGRSGGRRGPAHALRARAAALRATGAVAVRRHRVRASARWAGRAAQRLQRATRPPVPRR